MAGMASSSVRLLLDPAAPAGEPRSQLRGSAAHGARGPCAGLYELQASPGRRLWVNSEKLALKGVADERLPLDVSPRLPEGWDMPRSAGGNGRRALSGWKRVEDAPSLNLEASWITASTSLAPLRTARAPTGLLRRRRGRRTCVAHHGAVLSERPALDAILSR